ncbi:MULTISPECIES: ATP-binding protein [Kamptonema]|uniref:ATP-binding protein n=1 Tax=Kamptonema TaxID=1501433 RepID=UPI0001DACFE9|nr:MULTISPECIES: ATP-binding protein [Kamptonema]CBN54589.1 Sensor protein [Kamptonema sp. PCC 6506]
MAAPNRKIVKERRDYNTWVANETLEDYSLRYAPKSFRKWSEFLVANTAIGGISFLALEAIGGSLLISYGFANSFWAIITVGTIIFLAGLPIAYYASKYNIDIDLLTRGAGFGYIGSTITSLIYASFTFIFFALEAAIMAQALELYFHLSLPIGYVLCSLIIIPLVFYGVTLINQLQLWTQPIWLILMIAPYIFVLYKEPNALANWFKFAGESPSGAAFDPLLFGSAATVSFSLIAQLGEQVDYLRFLPNQEKDNRFRWWIAVIVAGPGWIVLGVAKQLGGAFLASLAISHGVAIASAKQPIQMYSAGFAYIFSNPSVVLSIATLFVIISQIKINVTNAYAGSLAWSNFFSRLTHSHPGRVVWLVFNVAIALLLMEMGVFETLEAVLGLYSNVAIAWIGALVADLVINKPLGLSPSYIEFKRAYLYNFNPVGFGSMAIASTISIIAFVGIFGIYAQAYAPFIALVLAFILSPIIAVITQGKYYIARENVYRQTAKFDSVFDSPDLLTNSLKSRSALASLLKEGILTPVFKRDWGELSISQESLIPCCICEQKYEPADMAFCPVYDGAICSLCCSLDARCGDKCKTASATIETMTLAIGQSIFKEKFSPRLGLRLATFLEIFVLISSLTGAIFGLVYYLGVVRSPEIPETTAEALIGVFLLQYALLLVLTGIATWWLVLSEESRELAEAGLDKQNLQLQQEIRERQRAETALQQLTRDLESRVEERTAELSEALSNLKYAQAQLVQTEKMSSLGQLVAGIAHEINNPVNFIYGNLEYIRIYVQDLLDLIAIYQAEFPQATPQIQEKIEEMELEFLQGDLLKILLSMKVGSERIRGIVMSLRVFSRLDESDLKSVDIHEGLDSTLMLLGHRLKANPDRPEIKIIKEYGNLPLVKCYAGQLNQVFMNIFTNAIDALEEQNLGRTLSDIKVNPNLITIHTAIINEGARVEIRIGDNGVGMSPKVREKVFDYLFTTKAVGKGTGLGLSISYQIVVEKHRGTLTCKSEVGQGTEFIIAIPIC